MGHCSGLGQEAPEWGSPSPCLGPARSLVAEPPTAATREPGQRGHGWRPPGCRCSPVSNSTEGSRRPSWPGCAAPALALGRSRGQGRCGWGWAGQSHWPWLHFPDLSFFFFFLQPYIYIIKISQKFLIFWLAGNNLADVLTPNHMFSFLVWNIWSVAIRLLLQDTLPISGKRAKTSNGRNERSETGSRPAWPGTPLGSAVWEAAGACDREWGGTWGRGSAQRSTDGPLNLSSPCQ